MIRNVQDFYSLRLLKGDEYILIDIYAYSGRKRENREVEEEKKMLTLMLILMLTLKL